MDPDPMVLFISMVHHTYGSSYLWFFPSFSFLGFIWRYDPNVVMISSYVMVLMISYISWPCSFHHHTQKWINIIHIWSIIQWHYSYIHHHRCRLQSIGYHSSYSAILRQTCFSLRYSSLDISSLFLSCSVISQLYQGNI